MAARAAVNSLPEDAVRAIVIRRGWQPGTHLEDQVSRFLSGLRRLPKPQQQYRIGRYRTDFAWPELKIALEADGWWHRSPQGAAKDRARDSWLRSQGWIVFRVDDEHGEQLLLEQAARVARIISSQTRT